MNGIRSAICFLWFASEIKLDASERNLEDAYVFPNGVKANLMPRVIGGHNALPHAYPYQALLNIVTTKRRSFFCGGTLVGEKWILTAAHCVFDNFAYAVIYLGFHDLSNSNEKGRQVYYSNKIFVHPNTNNFLNDIALIKLKKNVYIDDYVNVVNISSGNETYATQKAIIIGWGSTETINFSNVLKQVEVVVLSNDECKSTDLIYKSVIKNSHLCTSGFGIKGSCTGDSGGPLIVNNTQIGIVSFGPVNCTLGKPSVFTRVSEFNNWIQYTMLNDSNKVVIQVIPLYVLTLFFICFKL